jgi:ligand-binding SRPBCC domain-containing protein
VSDAAAGAVTIKRAEGSRYRLDSEIRVPGQLDDVFAFFSDALNLERLTPPWLRFRVVTPPPIAMERGATIDYKLRVRGIPLRWTSEIDAWEPPHRFADRQRRGPYALWVHEHTFEQVGGETLVRDRSTLPPAAARSQGGSSRATCGGSSRTATRAWRRSSRQPLFPRESGAPGDPEHSPLGSPGEQTRTHGETPRRNVNSATFPTRLRLTTETLPGKWLGSLHPTGGAP